MGKVGSLGAAHTPQVKQGEIIRLRIQTHLRIRQPGLLARVSFLIHANVQRGHWTQPGRNANATAMGSNSVGVSCAHM